VAQEPEDLQDKVTMAAAVPAITDVAVLVVEAVVQVLQVLVLILTVQEQVVMVSLQILQAQLFTMVAEVVEQKLVIPTALMAVPVVVDVVTSITR
jgi:hypothetical protein